MQWRSTACGDIEPWHGAWHADDRRCVDDGRGAEGGSEKDVMAAENSRNVLGGRAMTALGFDGGPLSRTCGCGQLMGIAVEGGDVNAHTMSGTCIVCGISSTDVDRAGQQDQGQRCDGSDERATCATKRYIYCHSR